MQAHFLACCVAGGVAAAAPVAADVDALMAINTSPDFPGRRVMLFSHVDGSLIRDDFINLRDVAPGLTVHVLKGIAQVGDEVWISDQSFGRIHRYHHRGEYIGTFGDGLLRNVRGMRYFDGVVYVTMAQATASIPAPAIVKFDTAGNLLGHFEVDPSPFDVFVVDSEELLLSHHLLAPSDLTRWSTSGAFLGNFHTGDISWAQQISIRRSNGNYLVAGWFTPTGIYEYDQAGNQVNYFSVPAPRAAYELQNGTIFWTGDGFHVYDVTTGLSTQIAIGYAQYIAPYVDPEAFCYADCNGDEVLGIDDFLCFMDEFAAAQQLSDPEQIAHYANCTRATEPPILGVDDFLCFMDEFARGCP